MSETGISDVWPGWEIEGVLGSGPFGTVYLIRSEAEGNTAFAAGKLIRVPPREEAVRSAEAMGISRDLLTTYFARFKNDLNWELTMFRTVKSSHLVSVEDVTVADAEGPGFTAYIRTGIYTPLAVYYDKVQPTQDDAVRLGREICSALEACSDFGMVHGEIKPENVLVADSGAFVLGDFGIKRCLEKAGTSIFGAVDSGFEAPELKKERKYTTATDVYALGTLLKYVANGLAFPEDEDPGSIQGLDRDFAAVISKATAENPAERYSSASEFRTALMKLPYGRKAPRRAMAAAAAFDMVKKNGGAIRTAVPAAALAVNGAKTAKEHPQETRDGSERSEARTESTGAKTSEGKSDLSLDKKSALKAEPERPIKPADRRQSLKRTRSMGVSDSSDGVSWLKPVLAAAVLVVLIIALLVVKPWESTPKTQGEVQKPDSMTLDDILQNGTGSGDAGDDGDDGSGASDGELVDPGSSGGQSDDTGSTGDGDSDTSGVDPGSSDTGSQGDNQGDTGSTGGSTGGDTGSTGGSTGGDTPGTTGSSDEGTGGNGAAEPETGNTSTEGNEYVSEGIAVGGGVVTATVLNIRSGPGTGYELLGGVPKDEVVVVLEKTSDEWLKVNYRGITGYCSARYVSGIREAKNFTATGVVIGDDIRMRSGPGTENDILGVYNKGTSLSVVGINNGWYKVVDGSTVGYIRSDLMVITG